MKNNLSKRTWNNNKINLYKRTLNNKIRTYELLSKTLTHVYLRNVENGFRFNEDIDSFCKYYEKV